MVTIQYYNVIHAEISHTTTPDSDSLHIWEKDERSYIIFGSKTLEMSPL